MSLQELDRSIIHEGGSVSAKADEYLRRSGAAAGSWLSRYGLLIAFLALWQAASTAGWINPAVFPSVGAILSALWTGISGGALLDDIAISLQRSGTAFVGAVVLAIPLGLLMGEVRPIENALDPVLQLMMDAVHRYEGTVNQVMGDGVMAPPARRAL